MGITAERCATCGEEYPYVLDPDDNEWWIDGEWWGETFHCSRHCYLTGAEYAAKKEVPDG